MGAFAYVVSLSVADNCVIICINLVLLMRWVDSHKYFCKFSETLTDVANVLVHKLFPVMVYRVIDMVPNTGPGPPHTLDSLTHIDC